MLQTEKSINRRKYHGINAYYKLKHILASRTSTVNKCWICKACIFSKLWLVGSVGNWAYEWGASAVNFLSRWFDFFAGRLNLDNYLKQFWKNSELWVKFPSHVEFGGGLSPSDCPPAPRISANDGSNEIRKWNTKRKYIEHRLARWSAKFGRA